MNWRFKNFVILAFGHRSFFGQTQDENLQQLPLSRPLEASSFAQYPVCDVSFASTICFQNQQQVILPDARPHGIKGHYTFDMIRPFDSSGEKNHAMGSTVAGPGFGTRGSSAAFRQNYLIIPHSPSFENSDYSVSFWLYVTEHKVEQGIEQKWCPIIFKGFQEKNSNSGQFESNPGILINTMTGFLKIFISTDAVQKNQAEFLISNFKIKPLKWYHITLVRFSFKLRLYINGILDSTMETLGLSRPNKSPFFVGSAPWAVETCDFPFLIDELKIYGIPLARDFIQAEAAASLSGNHPSNYYFSCIGCSKNQAEDGCPDPYHLCTKLELISGGYQVLKDFGLINPGTQFQVFIGEFGAVDTLIHLPEGTGNEKIGIGMCCRNSR